MPRLAEKAEKSFELKKNYQGCCTEMIHGCICRHLQEAIAYAESVLNSAAALFVVENIVRCDTNILP